MNNHSGVFVNSVESSPLRPRQESTINCASCSAAGAVCLLSLSHSAAVSEEASHYSEHLHDNAMSQLRFQMGSSVDAQIKNINNFILARTGCHGQEYPGFLTLNQANRWMLTKPMGSVFVIYAKGKIRGKEYCHFLNAVRAVNMVYVDFQTNRGGRITGRGRSYPPYPGSLGPATSTAPFVGIITQETASGGSHLHAARQPGSFEPDTLSLRVSAFIKF